jgi:hypothetical protein
VSAYPDGRLIVPEWIRGGIGNEPIKVIPLQEGDEPSRGTSEYNALLLETKGYKFNREELYVY